jgi:hypothetical protein
LKLPLASSLSAPAGASVTSCFSLPARSGTLAGLGVVHPLAVVAPVQLDDVRPGDKLKVSLLGLHDDAAVFRGGGTLNPA